MPDWIVIFLVMMGVALGSTGTLLVGYLWWSRRRFVLLKEALVMLTEHSARELLQARNSITLQSTIVARLRSDLHNVEAAIRELNRAPRGPEPPEDGAQQDPGFDPDEALESLRRDAEPRALMKEEKPERSTMWARLRDNIQDI